MKLIAGLGNPDDKYKHTRHNAGFMIIDELAKNWNVNFLNESKFQAQMCKTIFNNETVMLIKPQTYMKLSGISVAAVMNFYKIDIDNVLIVFDDLSLELGKLRFRANGSDGGHNGIKSIINHLHSNKFARLKFGIGPQPVNIPSEVFVLNNFAKSEDELLENTVKTASESIEFFLSEGMAKTQNKFN